MPPSTTPGRPAVAVAAALAVLLLGLLPVVNWLPGGHEVTWYPRVAEGWLWGTTLALGLGFILGLASLRTGHLWRAGAWSGLGAAAGRRPAGFTALLSLAALAAYLAVAVLVFDRRPLLIDEIIQLWQARVYAAGRLWLPSTGLTEFVGAMHLVDDGTRVYGQFPAGGPALLALGELVRAGWLVVPVAGAASVALFAALLGALEPRPGVRLGAALLFAFAPFALFMSGSYMNHVPTLTLVLIATLATARALGADAPRVGWALTAGLAYGAAATIRPVDALAFSFPAGLWYLTRALRDRRRWVDALAAAGGITVPVAAMLAVNAQTTGSPLLFGYEVLWGPQHGLGFHPAPWGPDHTPARGLELVNLYLLRLGTYFLETPFPALLPSVVSLALLQRMAPAERVLTAGSALLLALYFAYWHDGFYLGPRFLFPVLPLLALWTARAPALVRDRWGDGRAHRTLVFTLLVGGAIAAASGVPMRARQYANGMLTMRWDADRAAADAGVREALVLVRESWGSQLAVRLWSLGLSRTEAEHFYANVDACALEERVTQLARAGVRGAAAEQALRPLLADSAALEPTPYSQDHSERWLATYAYSPRCVRRIVEDRQGFTLYTPLILAQGSNVYARDLHGENGRLLERFPDRPIYLLRPIADTLGAPLRFHPVRRDSLRAAIAAERSEAVAR